MNPHPPSDPAPSAPAAKLSPAEAAGLFDLALEPNNMTPCEGAATDPPRATGLERSGDVIDRYTLVRCLGVGGCGVVWLAEQTQPWRRQVALKILKAGMDTREFIARFEQERQALALMDHPHIAKVFDAGTTATGRPYFVMEQVPGEALTDYCDARKLDVLARLRLFRQVCLAVEHAHAKGVVHRDLKPSNILVGEQDGAACPKVIDFGVAKAAPGHLTDKTLHTRIEQAIGTPGYMSPEQLNPRLGATDGRSDVYGLGAVLYELLTGEPPLDEEGLAQAAFAAVLRRVREEDPPPPSRRITSLAAERRATVAHQRGTPMQYLPGILRGNLDWLVMRCLEKEPRHRYQTPADLAADLQSYLNDGSVAARPTPWTRKAWRFLRRRRVAAVAAAVVTLALGVTGTAIVENRRMSAESHRLRFAARPLRHSQSSPPFVNSLGMAFQPVTLAFDSTDDPAGLADLWLATCETRHGEFATFLRESGHDMGPVAGVSTYYQNPEISWEHPGFDQTDEHPVVCVSWDDAMAFCSWLTEWDRKFKHIGPRDFYRLPTDREWSVAVGLRFEYGETPSTRAAVAQAAFDERGDGFPWGSAWPPPPQCGNLAADGVAGYRDPYPYTAPVGLFPEGEFGLHDMVGNVLEWCLEPGSSTKTRYDYMTVRGSGWGTCGRAELASANRSLGSPKAWRYPEIGFRCALVRFRDEPQNLLASTSTADWNDSLGTWLITPDRITQTDGKPIDNALLAPWLVWQKPDLPRDWLLEFRAAPDLPNGQGWAVCCKTLLIAYRFASPADYSAVTIGFGGVQILRQKADGELVTLGRYWGEADPEMAEQPVPYAVEVRGNWVRVFRKGVLMVEAEDNQRGNGSLAFEWVNVPGSLHGVRLSARR
ncbi:MAG: bifunctional serine/threonine-protein kinase/formylglycine-generating enzyme family protein [Verrucomicrobia bacterium]|nr:bifunctional serine/threonine-protein kinase/formylglycine-generating enzyme family protein [Verrucomicrobiota bacterium]